MRPTGPVCRIAVLLLLATGSALTTARAPAADIPDPCALLPEDLLRERFDVGDAEIARRNSEHSPHPLCLVSWPRPDAAERQAEFQKKLMDYAMAKAKGETLEMPKAPGNREISLTIFKDRFDSPAEAQSALDSGMKLIEKGMTSETDPSVKVLGHDVEPVADLGDQAAWVAALSQISVANGRRVFHLSVRVSDDPEENRAKAMELAEILLEKIQ